MKRLLLILLFIFLFAINANSAGLLAVTSPTPTGGGGGVTQVGVATGATAAESPTIATASRTLGSGTNRVLIACVMFYNGPGDKTVTGINYDSDAGAGSDKAFTKLGDVGTEIRGEIWYAVASESGGTGHFDVTFSGDIWGHVSVTEWTGVDQTTPLEGYAEATGDNATPTVNVSSATGTFVIDAAVSTTNAATVGANQTVQYSANTSDNVVWGASSIEGGAATVTMSWTFDSTGWSICAASLNPA
jgi:hypothetical protein